MHDEPPILNMVAVARLYYGGANLLSNLVCDDEEKVRIGLPVQVIFQSVSESITLPKFVPCVTIDAIL